MPRFVSVAVPVPFLDLLTYQIPDEMAAPVRGARVLVPLGSRLVTGIVVATAVPGFPPPPLATARPGRSAEREKASRAAGDVKLIVDVLDAEPFLPETIVDLALWVSEYYACGAGDALDAAMPPRATLQSERRIEITEAGVARVRLTGITGERRRSARRAEAIGGGGPDTMKARMLALLSPGKAVSISSLGRRWGRDPRSLVALHAAARQLEREGLVRLTQPVRGNASAHRTVRVASVTAQGHEPALKLGRRQIEALGLLRGAAEGLPLPSLKARGVSAETLARLAGKGLVRIRRERLERDPFATSVASGFPPPPEASARLTEGCLTAGDSAKAVGRTSENRVLTEDQTRVLETLKSAVASPGFSVFLLHGVTGSGKTEVYLRLAEVVRREGKSVLVLVPEIALTPAVASAFRETFGDDVAVQHSGLSDGERYDQWQRIRRREVFVVVGTRSAVFAPLSSLGLIVVDEEHDGSFKQEEAPRYHGRDVAVMRGKQEGALVLLGSATPSMESYQNAEAGRYARLVMRRRVQDRPLAAVRIVNMRDEYAARGPDVIVSEPLKAALESCLTAREQSLVLLNRRGLATAVFCRQCAGTLECPNCSVSLIVHTEGRGVHRARCHYCNFAQTVPKACPQCAGPYLERRGFGTERVAAEIAALWPSARIARLDRDAVRRKGSAARILASVARGEIDVLVGTQMIAKGHDFPGVTLVGVISADVGLGLADFRAAERTFQLLTQVAGRAGRGTRPGEAIVQTLYPEHYGIRHARDQNYETFFDEEIRYRRAMRYPPLQAMVNLIVRGDTPQAAMADAGGLAQRLRRGAEAGTYRVLGPAPAPFVKLRGEYRAQVFLKGSQRSAMRDAISAALDEHPDVRRRTLIDVDPLSVL